MSSAATPLAADTGFTFADPFALGVLGFGIALWIGIAALSHESERAFSASIFYLVLGLLAAASLGVVGVKQLDPLAKPALLEHVAEVALVIALFATGLRLESDLRWRTWRKVGRGS